MGKVVIRWIGQGGYSITDQEGVRYLIDPYLSDSVQRLEGPARLVPAPWTPETAPADYVLCSHDHLDHADPDTLPKMRGVRQFVGPALALAKMSEWGMQGALREIMRGQTLTVGRAQVSAFPAIHTPDSVGFLFAVDGLRLYFTGDSLFGPELDVLSGLRPDVLFTCINGKWGHMSYQEAVQLAGMMQPRLVVPMHYGMFAVNTVDPQLFVAALAASGLGISSEVLEYNREYTCELEGDHVKLLAKA
jgi:L-ascorbate 6-phosphate lactonase